MRGIAYGTLIAEWVAAVYGLIVVFRILREQHRDESPFIPWAELRHAATLRLTFLTQGNIMIRTFAMLAGFAWFIRQGAQLGETTLAANHVLLGLISFCAFFLDGFALSAESLVGAAKGRGDLPHFDRAVRRTTIFAGVTALGLAFILAVSGGWIITAMTDLVAVQAIAADLLPYVVVYVAFSFAAFQFDGIFIGTTHAREMRNASLISAALFMIASGLLTPAYGNSMLWLTFIAYVVVRALTLALYFPNIRRHIGADAA